MARNGSGTYSLPAGNPVVTGTTISSTVHNNTMTDIASEITNSVDKDGQTVITGVIDHNGQNIILDTDGDTLLDLGTDDQVGITIAGAADFLLLANIFRSLAGSVIETDTINETTAASGVTIDSVLVKDNTVLAGTLLLGAGSITDSSGAITFGNENLSTTGTLGAGVATLATGSTVGNLTLADGSITDSSGAITFGNENLSTTGTLGAGVATLASSSTVGNLTLADGSITDSSGAISFGNENLLTTGTLGAGATTVTTLDASGAITKGTAPTSANANADDLVVSTSAETGLTIFSGVANSGWIGFGDSGDNLAGRIVYDHSANDLSFGVGGVGDKLVINSTGATFAGDVTYTGASAGLTASDSGTADNTINLVNTGANMYVGLNGSAGNRFVGSTAYYATMGTTGADGIEFATNNTVRFDIDSAGAATFGGAVETNGTLTLDTGGSTALAIESSATFATFHNDTATIGTLTWSGSDFYIDASASGGGLVFRTNGGTTALTLDSSQGATFAGDVTATASTFHTLNNALANNFVAKINHTDATNPYGVIIDFTAGSPDDNTRQFLICDDSTTTRAVLYSDGDWANHDGVYGTISDRKLKTNFSPATTFTEQFRKLNYQTYQMKSDIEQYGPDCSKRLGLVVDEVEEIFPSLVMYHPDMETVEIEPAVDGVLNDDGEIVVEAREAVTETRQIVIDGVPQKTGAVKSSIIEGPVMAIVLQEALDIIDSLQARIERLERSKGALEQN